MFGMPPLYIPIYQIYRAASDALLTLPNVDSKKLLKKGLELSVARQGEISDAPSDAKKPTQISSLKMMFIES